MLYLYETHARARIDDFARRASRDLIRRTASPPTRRMTTFFGRGLVALGSGLIADEPTIRTLERRFHERAERLRCAA